MVKRNRKCPHCGELISDNSLIVCPFCAENISTKNTNLILYASKIGVFSKAKFTILALLSLVICIVVIVIYKYYMLNSLQGIISMGLKYFDSFETYTMENADPNTVDKAYFLANKGISKYSDNDMLYAIKGYAAWLKCKDKYYNSELSRHQIITNELYNESRKLTDQALNINPNNFLALQTYAEYYSIAHEDYNKAIEYINKAIKANPKYEQLYCIRAFINIKRGKIYDVTEDINTAIKYAPQKGMYYGYRASIKSTQGDLSAALKDANKSIKLNPNIPSLYLNRAIIEEQKENYSDALKDCNRAIEILKKKNDAFSLLVIKEYEQYKENIISKM